MANAREIDFARLVSFDSSIREEGYRILAGVDEAGRGAIAGPVVAAAVVCEPVDELRAVRDSKLISEPLREELYELIIGNALSWGVGVVNAEEIDRLNILNATLKAMAIAVGALDIRPDLVLVDGRKVPELDLEARAIVDGDNRSFVIALASIVAKVTRDRIMRGKEFEYPGYGFTRHKGYGTRQHIEAIKKLGVAPIHRKSFQVKELS